MSEPWLIGAVDIIFIVGTLLFFAGFFIVLAASLYPMAIFLVGLLFIRIFHEKIASFGISKDGLVIKLKEAAEKDSEKLELLKKRWNYFEEENKHVQ